MVGGFILKYFPYYERLPTQSTKGTRYELQSRDRASYL